MKKLTIFVLITALVFCTSACGKRKKQDNTVPSETTQPITVPTLPDMTIPSTNIPDPTVESHSTTPTIADDDSGNMPGETEEAEKDPTE